MNRTQNRGELPLHAENPHAKDGFLPLATIHDCSAAPPPATPASWLAAINGNWTNAADWSTGTVPNASNDATIGATGTYTVTISSAVAANSLTIGAAGATVSDTGTLSLATTLSLTAGTFALGSQGVVQGGTLSAGGGIFAWMGGTLSGVTYAGVLSLGRAGQDLTLTGATTLTNGGTISLAGSSIVLTVEGALAGATTINDTGNSSYLYLYDSRTLAGITLNIGNNAGLSRLVEYSSGGHATLTLGPNTVLNQAGTYAFIYIDEQSTGNQLINQGTMHAGAAGGTMTLSGSYAGDSFTNQGSIIVSNGDDFSLGLVTSFTNLAGGILSGGSYEVDAGSSFQLTANSFIGIDAATIILSGAKSLVRSLNTVTGKQVSLDSSLYEIAAGGALSLRAGRSFTAQANGGIFEDNGSLTLAAGTLTAATLTIGTFGVLAGAGAVHGTLLDNGTIQAAGGTLTLYNGVSGSGMLDIADGGTAVIRGDLTVTAAAVQSGGTLDLSGGGTIGGTISGAGTLQLDSGGGSFTIGAGTMLAIGLLDVESGKLSGAGKIAGGVVDNGTLAAIGGTLAVAGGFIGAGTLTAAKGAVLDLAAGGILTGSISGGGTLELGGIVFFDNPTATIATVQADVATSIIGSGTVSGKLSDSGTVTASGGTLVLAGRVSGAGTVAAAAGSEVAFTGGGALSGSIAGAGTVLVASAVTLAAGAVLASANVMVTGKLVLGAGENVTSSSGNHFAIVAASGGAAFLNGAAGDLFTNAGSFTAGGTGAASVGAAFTNSGNVIVTAGSLAFLGPVTNEGVMEASSGLLSIAATVSGTGALAIDAAGTLSLTQGVSAGQNVDFAASAGLLDLAHPTSFVGLIAGFGGSDQIDLVNTPESSFNFAGGTLSVMNGANVVADLQFAGSYSNANFEFAADNHGGMIILFV